MNEARNEILTEYGWDRKAICVTDYNMLQDKAKIARKRESPAVKKSNQARETERGNDTI